MGGFCAAALLVAQGLISAPALPDVSVTLSPFALFYPIVELTGEYRIYDKLGAAVVLGGGRGNNFGGNDLTFMEAGLQVRAYPAGTFRNGMQFGVELVGERVSQGADGNRFGGVAIGGFGGYKLATRFGFTFEVQTGLARVYARRTHESGRTATKEETQFIFNANFGWSFHL